MGSPNLDPRSEELNFEIAVVTADRGVCQAAGELFEERLATGRSVHADDLERAWYDPLANGFCRLLSPLL